MINTLSYEKITNRLNTTYLDISANGSAEVRRLAAIYVRLIEGPPVSIQTVVDASDNLQEAAFHYASFLRVPRKTQQIVGEAVREATVSAAMQRGNS